MWTHLELTAFPREHGGLALGYKVVPPIRSKLSTIHLGMASSELEPTGWKREDGQTITRAAWGGTRDRQTLMAMASPCSSSNRYSLSRSSVHGCVEEGAKELFITKRKRRREEERGKGGQAVVDGRGRVSSPVRSSPHLARPTSEANLMRYTLQHWIPCQVTVWDKSKTQTSHRYAFARWDHRGLTGRSRNQTAARDRHLDCDRKEGSRKLAEL